MFEVITFQSRDMVEQLGVFAERLEDALVRMGA